MAPKPSILLHQPSELEEERQQSSEDESEARQRSDESEEEQENQENSSDDESEGATDDDDEVKGTPNPSKYLIPVPKSNSKLISPRNGSDSDPDSEGTASDYRLQPIRKGSLSSSKRSREEDNGVQEFSTGNRSSRVEDKKPASTPGGGGGCINRLWNDDDEIAVLNGMIEFKTLKGVSPTLDMGLFHSFIKGKLNVDFSKDQLKSKIIRLKKRFLNALKKGSNGVPLKPHEVMAFEISKKIWGGAVDGGRSENVKKKRKKVEKHVVDERGAGEEESVGGGGGFWSKYSYLHASLDNMNGAFRSRMLPVGGKSLLEEKLSLIGKEKAKELDDKWKQLCVEETQLNYKILMLSPLKAFDIRHVIKEDKSPGSGDLHRVRTRCRFKRTASKAKRSRVWIGSPEESGNEEAKRSPSHESSLSHQSGTVVEGWSRQREESLGSAETPEPEAGAEANNSMSEERPEVDCEEGIELDLALGLEPVKRCVKQKPKPREAGEVAGICKMELGL